MHSDTFGSGDPVLLLHGAGVSGWMWRPLLEHLGRDLTAIVPDLPGFGRSAHRPYVSHQETVAELADLIRRTAPRGAHVVGFSLGAQLAILLASHHPDLVLGTVVVSAETTPAPLPGTTLALVSATAPLARRAWFARAQARQLAIPADLMPDYVRDSAATTRETLVASVGENIRFTLPSAWSTVSTPVAVLVGEKERRLMRESARLTADQVQGDGPRTVEGAGHDIPFTRPAVLATVIRETFGIPTDGGHPPGPEPRD
ncbi:alpha/beta fold hydrolase [Actinoalloteichus caeruleus]|uniref:Pimeloyl-ACP methyl ester carboxylesterase n=1 Tax=Actinoalloteichus caeruleus DSM 43889 TaxID=1120930 RepID=A0ABT1JE95_ACTCY|nr:alpha/beta hydrolase [Actinoalloteichus caeruleus]MCP2330818.1 Pimeloyl-ACP methyl ester carboxylesterase [Actinoalloteichus caeruleus DSM 43889]